MKNFKTLGFLLAFLCSPMPASELLSQCFTQDNPPQIRPTHINIVLVIDQAWVDFWGGNQAFARMKAEMLLDNTLQEIYSTTEESLNNANRILRSYYKVTFKKIFFPNLLSPPPVDFSNIADWSDKTEKFVENNFPCIPFEKSYYFLGTWEEAISSGLEMLRFLGIRGIQKKLLRTKSATPSAFSI